LMRHIARQMFEVNEALGIPRYSTHEERLKAIRWRVKPPPKPPPIGGRHGRSKLTEKDVAEIRRLRYLDNWTEINLSKRYGITPQNVSLIVLGRTWRHVHMPPDPFGDHQQGEQHGHSQENERPEEERSAHVPP
jgi:hypothetical protein